MPYFETPFQDPGARFSLADILKTRRSDEEDTMARILGGLGDYGGDYGERPPARRKKRKEKPATSMRADLIEAAGLLLASLGDKGYREYDVFRTRSRGITDRVEPDRAAPAQPDEYEPFKTFPIRESDLQVDPIEGLTPAHIRRLPAPDPYGDSADIREQRTFSRPRIGYPRVEPELPPRIKLPPPIEPIMVEQPSAAERRASNTRKAAAQAVEFQAWLNERKLARLKEYELIGLARERD